jgi:cytochrome bd-type quinol oxidase subunit 1
VVEYPIFDAPMLGGAMVIAIVAIVHVVIAHFSVGSGFFVAYAERRAITAGESDVLAFLKKYALLVLLVPYVLGTVTGAGIWFTVALVSPRAISVLVHQFVWDWAAEWVLFLIEVVAIYLYFFTWDRIRPRAHNAIGWVFAAASMLTLLVINAILSFMLTPGSWAPHAPLAVWKGIFNPSYVPTALMRALVAVALAGAGAVALAAVVRGLTDRARDRVVSLGYKMMLPAVLCLPLAGWTFAVLPDRAKDFLQGGAPVMTIFLAFGVTSFAILTAGAALSLWRRDYRPSTLGATMLVLLALVGMGSMEFVREGVRKPYIIDGFMYSTGVTTAMADGIDPTATLERTRRDGILSAAPWALPPGRTAADLAADERGRCVYRAACLRCHSLQGYNALGPLVAGWSRPTLRHLLDRMDEVKPSMPPFPGTEAEKEALADFLADLAAGGGKS